MDMAVRSSRFGSPHSTNLSNEVDARKQWRQNVSFEVWTLGCPRSSNVEFRAFVKRATLWISTEYRRSRRISKREKQRFGVMSMLQPETEPESESSGPTITVLKEGGEVSIAKDFVVLETSPTPNTDNGGVGGDSFGSGGGNGKVPFGGGGGGGGSGSGDDHEEDDNEEEELGPIMKFKEVIKETEARGASLPSDMLEAAKTVGIRKVHLLRFLDLQESVWPLGFAIKSCSMLRNRMLADPSFLFKIGTEVCSTSFDMVLLLKLYLTFSSTNMVVLTTDSHRDTLVPVPQRTCDIPWINPGSFNGELPLLIVIDSCCATFAEVQKRGKDFWAEFELYVADLLVGVVVNIALVGMLAPYARIGHPSISKGILGRMQLAYGALPSSVFEAERPGCRFTVKQRVATYFYKGVLYASVGFACGLIGQGIANLIMTAKRSIKKSEEDIPVPPLVKSAVLWAQSVFAAAQLEGVVYRLIGVFLAVSSNTRYQVINGLEYLVEASPLAKQVPPVALAFTVGRLSTSLRDDIQSNQENQEESTTSEESVNNDHVPPRSSKSMVTGTIFGHRRGHVWFCIQHDRLNTKPTLLLEFSIPIYLLVKEMQCGLVRIALECNRADMSEFPLHSIPIWTVHCNGRKVGYAARRKATDKDRLMLKTMQSMTVGAGVIPAELSSEGDGELMYMRANYERVAGSFDSESFHLINLDECPGQEFSVFLLRSQ
ncbi:hypothetical protein HHK36_016299 [Tetracentron sinense]|uniref:Uncharacterized protein n=1 Tax=Tetracentron sinense TaxID=13715 RepID=A0A834Z522_TETSI|nr:hypothetical protein HHK36_016299 [Tetracentron sinense]